MRLRLAILIVPLGMIAVSCGTKKNRTEQGPPPSDRSDCFEANDRDCRNFIDISDSDKLVDRNIDDRDREEYPDLDNPIQAEDTWSKYDPSQSDHDTHEPDFSVGDKKSKLVIRKARSQLILGGDKDRNFGGCLRYARTHHQRSLLLDIKSLRPSANLVGLGDSVRCEVELQLRLPKGFQFAVRQIDTSIRSDLSASSVGTFQASFGFDAKESDYQLERVYHGNRLYHELDQLKINESQWRWSNCSGSQNFYLNFDLSTNFKNLPNTPKKWEVALRRKKTYGSEHGQLLFGDLGPHKEVPLQISWRRCRS